MQIDSRICATFDRMLAVADEQTSRWVLHFFEIFSCQGSSNVVLFQRTLFMR